MKTCPHCGGEIRPSVIRCTHCGQPLTEPAAGAAGAPGPSAAGPGSPVLGASPPSSGVGVPAGPALEPEPSPAAAPPRPAPRPTGGDVWITPATRADVRQASFVALPPPVVLAPDRNPASRTRARTLDGLLMVGAGLLVLAAALMYTSLDVFWVRARLSTATDRGQFRPVADMTFRATDSLAGTVGLVLAVGFAVYGIVWFWYGLDRGVHLPAVFHPGFVGLGAAAAWLVAIFAGLGSFFWDDAFAANARGAGMSKGAMAELLAHHPPPKIAVEVLEGVVRFRVSAGLALLAALLGAWTTSRRYR
jgi:hypothetical protein